MEIPEVRRFFDFLTSGYPAGIFWELRFISDIRTFSEYFDCGHAAAAWLEQNQADVEKFNIYIGTMPRNIADGHDDAVSMSNLYYIDLDSPKAIIDSREIYTKLSNEYNLRPSLVINSGHGLHIYWKLEEAVPIGEWRRTQEAMIRFFKDKFPQYRPDPVVKNPSRIMRVVGTMNIKSEPHTMCEIIIPDFSIHRRLTVPNGYYIDSDLKIQDVIEEKSAMHIEMSDMIKDMIAKGASSGERHQKEFVITKELYHCGYTPDEIVSYALKFNSNCRPPKAEAVVRTHVRHLLRNAEIYLKMDGEYNEKRIRELFFKKVHESKDGDEEKDIWKFVPDKLAKVIMKNDIYRTNRDSGEMYYYRKGVYASGGDMRIKSMCKRFMEALLNRNYAEETVFSIKTYTSEEPEEFEEDANWICLKNGLYNIETKDFIKHTPKIVCFSKLPVDFKPEAKCETFLKFLKEILEENDIITIQEFFGYCLYKKYHIAKALMLTGAGANGKSTLLDVLVAMLGRDNTESISMQQLEENKFTKARLFGKLANICADLQATDLEEVGTFKSLTGGDLITGEKKYGGFVKFKNFAKMLFACNQIPTASEESDAFFRRWIVIQFPNQFEGDKADPTLINKLTTEDELAGIFNWSLEGLYKLLTNKLFTNAKTFEASKKEYMMLANPTAYFFREECEVEWGDHIFKDEFYKQFTLWCRQRKLKAKNVPNNKIVGHRLMKLPEIEGIVTADSKAFDTDGERKNVYKNIRFKVKEGLNKHV